MKVTLIQSDIVWENHLANLDYLDREFDKQELELYESDIIVLPEMFSTGFSMNTSLALGKGSVVEKWLLALAVKYQVLVVAGVMEFLDFEYINRALVVFPDGVISRYSKRHLFGLASENEHFKAGERKLVVSWKGFKINLAICYDLRFPAWLQNNSKDPYDVLVVIANWPSKRISAWSKLLEARAIENQVFVVGVNRMGFDGNGYDYPGCSTVVDPYGDIILKMNNSQFCASTVLDIFVIKDIREKLPFYRDLDFLKFL